MQQRHVQLYAPSSSPRHAVLTVTTRWVFICICGVSGLLPLASAAQSNNTAQGRWRIHGWLDGDDLEAQCNLILSGRLLRGTCSTDQGVSEITGQITGPSISWSYNLDIGGVLTTVRYSGTLGGRTMSGKIAANENPSAGAFRAEMIR